MIVCMCFGEDVIMVEGGEIVIVFVCLIVFVDVIGVGDLFVVGFFYGYVIG